MKWKGTACGDPLISFFIHYIEEFVVELELRWVQKSFVKIIANYL